MGDDRALARVSTTRRPTWFRTPKENSPTGPDLASAIGNESRSHAPIWSMQPPIAWRTVRDTFTEVVVVELRETTRPAHLADLKEHQDQMGLVGP
jgi:hypothetical protein